MLLNLPFYGCFGQGFSEGTWASKQSARSRDFLYYFSHNFYVPFTVDEQSKARTVIARVDARTVGLNPTRGMDV
jgi:hypothetical protein